MNECCLVLQEILDVACSHPLLTVSGGRVRLVARADSALLEPRLLLLLLRAWPHLHNVQVTSVLLQTFQLCLY